MTAEPQTHLYRYEDHCDVVVPCTYLIVRRTPKGVWIEIPGRYPPKQKFVLIDARKRFAHETWEDAKISFLARKARQFQIMNARIENIQDAVTALKEGRINDYSRSRCFD